MVPGVKIISNDCEVKVVDVEVKVEFCNETFQCFILGNRNFPKSAAKSTVLKPQKWFLPKNKWGLNTPLFTPLFLK